MQSRSRKTKDKANEKAKEKYTLQSKLKHIKTPWKNLPEDWYSYEGFVYKITNLQTGQKYIGKKGFWLNRKGKIYKESDWEYYKSSSIPLLKDINSLGIDKFSFLILSVHRNLRDLAEAEIQEQFSRNVLKSVLPSGLNEYYNDNIMSKFFRPKDFGTIEYYEKCDQISRKLKEGYETGKIQHSMLGKQHPNKGKKLPQTGHQKNKGKQWWTNGKENKLLPLDNTPPSGFTLGLTFFKKRKKKEKEIIYSFCPWCNKSFPVLKGNQKYCSTFCTYQASKARARIRYKERNP